MGSSSFVAPPPPYGHPGCSISSANYHPSAEQLATLLDHSNSIKRTLQIHAFLLRRNLPDHTILSFKLHRSYSSLGHLNKSLSVFSQTSSPNVYFFTAVVQTLILYRLHERAIAVYVQMLERNIIPNEFTLSSILKSCPLEAGKQIQGHAVKFGLHAELYVRTSLMEIYTKFSDVVSAGKLFEMMPDRSVVSLTAMISCYVKAGMVEEARTLFDELEDKDAVLWNVMINGYVRQGIPTEGLTLFRQMLSTNVRPTEVTIVAALSACAHTGALESGRWIHSYMKHNRVAINVHVNTALVDMYGKCGSLEDAQMVFEKMSEKDVVSWNAMIMSYAIHGYGRRACQLFDCLIQKGYKPTNSTFVALLHACGHSGLVNEGLGFFRAMLCRYGVEPKVEHYGCMVHLLARAGRLDEACALIKDMEVDRDYVLLNTLLGACKVHGNVELGTKIADILMNQNIARSGTFIMLLNMQATVGNWEAVGRVRSSMQENGVEKEPGCSSIEVNNKVHEFHAGDRRHPKSKEIYAVLEEGGAHPVARTF